MSMVEINNEPCLVGSFVLRSFVHKQKVSKDDESGVGSKEGMNGCVRNIGVGRFWVLNEYART